MKTLVFTAQSQYARFRCPHTTTSALTFLTIHPIAIKGLLGAIRGIDYSKLYDYTKDMKIGIQVLNPVSKDTQSFNLIAQTGNNGAANFQSRVQFLRDVKYRIFVIDQEEELKHLKDAIEKHNYVFTPYLGCSEHVAKLCLEGMFVARQGATEIVHTVVPKEFVLLNSETFNEKTILYMDRIPTKNSKEREYTEYKNVIFGADQPVKVRECQIFEVGDKNVFFF